MKPRSAQVARADLLRALAHHGRDQLTLSADEQHWWGYRYTPPVSEVRMVFAAAVEGPPPQVWFHRTDISSPEADNPIKQLLRMDWAWLVQQHPRDDAEPATASAAPVVEPLDAAACAAAADQPQAVQDDLLPWPRLLPVLRRRLAQSRWAGVDVPRLLQALARQQTLRHLPRVQRRRWNPDLIVALDFGPAMTPYRTDLHRLCRQLLREVGRTGLSLRLLGRRSAAGWG